MSAMSLPWFSMIPVESASNSFTVPKPLDPANNVAKPTKYGVSRTVAQSDDERSFFVAILVGDAFNDSRVYFLRCTRATAIVVNKRAKYLPTYCATQNKPV